MCRSWPASISFGARSFMDSWILTVQKLDMNPAPYFLCEFDTGAMSGEEYDIDYPPTPRGTNEHFPTTNKYCKMETAFQLIFTWPIYERSGWSHLVGCGGMIGASSSNSSNSKNSPITGLFTLSWRVNASHKKFRKPTMRSSITSFDRQLSSMKVLGGRLFRNPNAPPGSSFRQSESNCEYRRRHDDCVSPRKTSIS